MMMVRRRCQFRLYSLVCLALVLIVATSCGKSDTREVPVGKELCKSPGFSVVRIADKDMPDESGIELGPSGRKVMAERLLSVLCSAWQVNPGYIDLRVDLPAGRYNMTLPGTNDPTYNTEAAFAKGFQEAFHLKFHWEQKDIQVLVVGVSPGKPPSAIKRSSPDESQSSLTDGGEQKFSAYSMDDLCEWMEREMQKTPVINESGLAGNYDFALDGEVLFDDTAIPKCVRALGLDVRNDTRRLRVLVVERE